MLGILLVSFASAGSDVILTGKKGATIILPQECTSCTFVKINSIPKHLPRHEMWALNSDDLLHPDFKVDYKKHIVSAIKFYEPLFKAVKIDTNQFIDNHRAL